MKIFFYLKFLNYIYDRTIDNLNRVKILKLCKPREMRFSKKIFRYTKKSN